MISVEKATDWSTECDSCGGTIEIGELALTGIESCCGQCTRTLCEECLEEAARQLGALRSADGSGTTPDLEP
jgi:hypothetical protein